MSGITAERAEEVYQKRTGDLSETAHIMRGKPQRAFEIGSFFLSGGNRVFLHFSPF